MLPVEHALPSPHENHPWRTIAVVAVGIATLELVGLVLAGTALFVKPVADKAHAASLKQASSTPAQRAPARAILPRGKVGVTVLNANGIAGAAATEADQVRARGYRIRFVGNATSSYARTMVMYRPGFRPEALRLARDVGIRLVWPLDGLRPRSLRGAQVALVLGG
jgi:LytR cell envelope-related transcriptional attenuator